MQLNALHCICYCFAPAFHFAGFRYSRSYVADVYQANAAVYMARLGALLGAPATLRHPKEECLMPKNIFACARITRGAPSSSKPV